MPMNIQLEVQFIVQNGRLVKVEKKARFEKRDLLEEERGEG